jgi:L-ribulose-5-phosphate 3-epimerase
MLDFPLSGLSDEAADSIDGQIAAHRALGWAFLELRLVDGKQVSSAQYPEDSFDQVAYKIARAGMKVSGFASAIGNWSRPLRGDFSVDLDDLRAVIPRMQKVGARFLRTMSWDGKGVPEEEWRDEAIRRYQEMAPIAAEAGVVLLHENCTGWAALGPEQACEFFERVAHPNVRMLFDIGNTVAFGQDTWSFYQAVRPFIEYVHIKDCRYHPQRGESSEFTYPGEGDARVGEILLDLLRSGYRAGAAIEPHVASIVHLGASTASPEQRFESYLKYGRQAERMLYQLTR